MEEGFFKQTSDPILFEEKNGVKVFLINFDELVKPLN
jgi:hypothetical protein